MKVQHRIAYSWSSPGFGPLSGAVVVEASYDQNFTMPLAPGVEAVLPLRWQQPKLKSLYLHVTADCKVDFSGVEIELAADCPFVFVRKAGFPFPLAHDVELVKIVSQEECMLTVRAAVDS